MKRPITDSKRLNLVRMFDEFARQEGISFSDEEANNNFVEQVAAALGKHRQTPTVMHGFRAQTMFAYVAAALGGCRIITEEDSGDIFTDDAALRRPDFRILTADGLEIFVEVKNFDQRDCTSKKFKQTLDYVDSLRRYATAFGKPLYFAIYWSRWQLWTLTPENCFAVSGTSCSLELTEAVKTDELRILGDCHIGVTKPLALRFYTDASKPRSVDADGHVEYTVERAAYLAGGKEVTDKFEQKLAWFFLNYGRWHQIERLPKIENGELLSMDFSGIVEDLEPIQEEVLQDFVMIGRLSQMISKQFDFLTTENGEVLRLSPQVEPEKLGVLIPKEHCGDVLGIWRFYQWSALAESKRQAAEL